MVTLCVLVSANGTLNIVIHQKVHIQIGSW